MIIKEYFITDVKNFLNQLKKEDVCLYVDFSEDGKSEKLIYESMDEGKKRRTEFFIQKDEQERKKIMIDYKSFSNVQTLNHKAEYYDIARRLSEYVKEEFPETDVYFSERIEVVLKRYLINAKTVLDMYYALKKAVDVNILSLEAFEKEKIEIITAKSEVIQMLEELSFITCELISKNCYKIKQLNIEEEVLIYLIEQLAKKGFPVFVELESEVKPEGYSLEMIDQLIDVSLQIKDEKWFYELIEEKNKLLKK